MKYLPTVLLIVLVTVLIGLLAPPAAAQDDPDLRQTMEWPAYDVRINYPADWVGTPIDEDTLIYVNSVAQDDPAAYSLGIIAVDEVSTFAASDPAPTFAFGEEVLGNVLGGITGQSLAAGDFAVAPLATETYGTIPVSTVREDPYETHFTLLFYPDDLDRALLVFLDVASPTDTAADLDLLAAMIETLQFGTAEATEDDALSDPSEEAVPLDGRLVAGETERGTISDAEDAQPYTFDAEAGDVITISMIADDTTRLDTVLELYDANGELVTANDDGFEGTLNSQLTYIISDSGRYEIVATRYDGVGGYAITLDVVSSGSVAGATPMDGILLPGETEVNTITDADDAQPYTFEGAAGDRVTIRMAANDEGELDTTLQLRDPSGELVAENDDADGSTYNSLIEYTLATTGTYTIVATRFDGEGLYAISLVLTSEGDGTGSATDAAIPTSVPTAVPTTSATSSGGAITDFERTIAIGDTVTGELSPANNQQILYFEGEAGQTVTVTLTPITGDVSQYMLSVFDTASESNGAVLDDALSLTVRLLPNGSYGVYVLSTDVATANRYTLTLE